MFADVPKINKNKKSTELHNKKVITVNKTIQNYINTKNISILQCTYKNEIKKSY